MRSNSSNENKKSVMQARFLVLWLSKFLFSELPSYGVKSMFFSLTIRMARGTRYPLAPMFLGYIYSQLDLLHADEIEGNFCYAITSSLYYAILQIFVWDHS